MVGRQQLIVDEVIEEFWGKDRVYKQECDAASYKG